MFNPSAPSRAFGRAARTFLLSVSALALCGCSFFPKSGPDFRDIQSTAVDGIPVEQQQVTPIPYAIVDLTGRVVSQLPDIGVGSIYTSFGAQSKLGAPNIRIAEGDVLQITVFESQPGGLFIPREASVRPGNFVQFPSQVVDRSGQLAVPYADSVRVLGRSLTEVQDDIRQRLEPKAIQPQVIVSVVDRATDASVVGEVNAPNRFRINYGGDRILDLISRAGGPRYPGWDTYVTLQRGSRKATVFFNQLVNAPRENIFVAPGDILYVYRQQRFFTIFGATGVQSRFDFDAERLYLSDAIGRALGLDDTRANPGEVYVYRLEDRAIAQQMDVTLGAFPPDQRLIPVVYKLNLRLSDGYFLAQRFPVRDRDLIYVANADQTELRKFLELINNVSGTAYNVSIVRNSVR